MIGFLIVSHGNFSQGVLSAVEMIYGKAQRVEYLSLQPDQSPEEFKEEVDLKISTLDQGEGIIIFTDVQGGTPFNICSNIAIQNELIEVITGFNLVMIIEALTLREREDIKNLSREIVKIGVSSIKILSELI